VQGTNGAELHPRLNNAKIQKVFLKGTGNKDDGYSAYEATNEDLERFLKSKGITELYVTGLATDYCVRASALDGEKKGLRTSVVTDAIAAVNVNPGDGEKALKEMELAGIRLVLSSEIR
jgi:nicotinamidase/pyrazinamidase